MIAEVTSLFLCGAGSLRPSGCCAFDKTVKGPPHGRLNCYIREDCCPTKQKNTSGVYVDHR